MARSMIDEKYLRDIKFLIVEDNTFMRMIIRLVLKALGTREIMEASDGATAMKIMTAFKPDIAIVDWEMEPMDGITFVKTLRTASDSADPFLPIVLVSAHSETSRILEARDAGINEFLVKPISATALYSRIEAVIERPRPFVRVKGYFGPDRRRQNRDYTGEERRKEPCGPAAQPPDTEMTQEEVNAFLNPDTEELPVRETADADSP